MMNTHITAAIQSLVDARNEGLAQLGKIDEQIASLTMMMNGTAPISQENTNSGIRSRVEALMADHLERNYPEICDKVGAKTTKEKNAVSALLSTQIKKGTMLRPSYGHYRKAKRVFKKKPEKVVKVEEVPAKKHLGMKPNPNSTRQIVLAACPTGVEFTVKNLFQFTDVKAQAQKVWPDLSDSRKCGRLGSHLANLENAGKLRRVREGVYIK